MKEQQRLIEYGYAEKIRQRAKLVSQNGDVSPLCAIKPRRINLKKESWTNRDGAVTCPKCLEIIKGRTNGRG